MRKFLIAIGFLAVIGTPVLAAPVYSWSGFYVGGTLGTAWGNSFQSFSSSDFGTTGNYGTHGVVGGATAGFNWQGAPNWLAGIETDISAATIHGTGGTTATYNCGMYCTSNVDMFGTVRGRAGFVAGDTVFYATGGYAYGREDANFGGQLLGSSVRGGWTAGGGVEYRFTQHWSAKVEYLYVKLNSFIWTNAVNGISSCVGINCTMGNKFNVVRGGLNFSLD